MTPDQVPAAFVRRVAEIESGGNPLARARTSTATGLFQFILSTWAGLMKAHPELRLTADGRIDPAQAERAFRVFTAENAECFRMGVGRDPTLAELYLCHFLGSRRASEVVRANPTRPVAEVCGAAVVRANAFLSGSTCGWLRDWAERKIQGRA